MQENVSTLRVLSNATVSQATLGPGVKLISMNVFRTLARMMLHALTRLVNSIASVCQVQDLCKIIKSFNYVVMCLCFSTQFLMSSDFQAMKAHTVKSIQMNAPATLAYTMANASIKSTSFTVNALQVREEINKAALLCKVAVNLQPWAVFYQFSIEESHFSSFFFSPLCLANA